MKSISILIGLATLYIGMPALARAEGVSNPMILDVEKLPLVQSRPRPEFDSKTFMPSGEELKSAPEVDFAKGEIAKWDGPKGRSNLSVVISRSVRDWDNSQAHSWTRFLQKNGEAEAATVNCFRGIEGFRAVESFTLGQRKDGQMHYRYSLIWMNYSTCKGFVLRSEDTPVHELGNGMAYAFQSECKACKAGERRKLHIVAPSVDTGGVSSEDGRFVYWTRLINHISMPLGEGLAGALTASFSPESIQLWNRAARSKVQVGAKRLRLEVSRAAGEENSIGLVWVN